MKKLLLIDSHALIHRAYHGLPEFYSSKGVPTGALFGVVNTLVSVIKEINPEYIIAAFDMPKKTFRHTAFKEYKANRKKAEKDLALQLKKAKEIFNFFGAEIFCKEGYEADDIIGTISEKLKQKKDLKIIILTGDLDTLQLVDDNKVVVYTFRRSLKDNVLYNEEAVVKRYGFSPKLLPDYKGLCGDQSDNIPGIKGVGEKTAGYLVKTFGDLDSIFYTLKNHPEKVELSERVKKILLEGEEEAYFSKMLATIKKDVPLPKIDLKFWKDNVKKDELLKLLSELEIRAPLPRLMELIGENVEFDTSSLIFKEAAVMLWLLRSDITDPQPKDIFAFTKIKSIKKSHQILRAQITKEELDFVYEQIERPLIKVIDKMNEIGIRLDKKKLDQLSEEFNRELKEIEKQIFDLAGEEFNVKSPKQLGYILFEKLKLKKSKKTKTGQYKTDEDTLQKLKREHKIIDLVLKHRELQKLISTYIDVFKEKVSKDGRLRTHFIQTGTTTGRISSRDPNLQNIPVRTQNGLKIRELFIAKEGFVLISFDYSQIELKIAAILSKDKELIRLFNEGKDIHTAVAAKIFNVDENEVTPEQRRKAKVINFGILYGMGARALKDNLGKSTTLEEAKKYLENYFNHFADLAKWIQQTKKQAYELGYTKTLYGRKRHFESIRSNIPYIRHQAERMATNAPIQGTQADIIKMAMHKTFDFLQKNYPHSNIVLQIHDEIIIEAKKENLADIVPAVKNIMESIVEPDKALVPITVDVKYGDNWKDMQKYEL